MVKILFLRIFCGVSQIKTFVHCCSKLKKSFFAKEKQLWIQRINLLKLLTHSVKVLTVKCTTAPEFLIFNAFLKTSVCPLVGNKQNLTHPQENPFAV